MWDRVMGGEEVYRVRVRVGTQGGREVERLREEAERPGDTALQGLLTCRLHISELQSILILQGWVTEAVLAACTAYVCAFLHAGLNFWKVFVCTCQLMCKSVCKRAGNSYKCEVLM